jgi:hypothetical protein
MQKYKFSFQVLLYYWHFSNRANLIWLLMPRLSICFKWMITIKHSRLCWCFFNQQTAISRSIHPLFVVSNYGRLCQETLSPGWRHGFPQFPDQGAKLGLYF